MIVCAVLAWSACVSAVVNVVTGYNPTFALGLTPNDPNALVANVDVALSQTNLNQRTLVSKSRDVEAALYGQAINPRGLRQLGLIVDAKGQTKAAQSLMELSSKLSRRDFAAQLWLIEDGVRSGDVASTMTRYDVALRTSAESASILHPILSAALSDDEIQRVFAPYLRTNAPWMASFLSFAINTGNAPVVVANAILKGGGLPDNPNYRIIRSQLLQQLAAKGAFVEAFQYYSQLKAADQRIPTSTAFEKSTVDPEFAPLTWQLQNSSGIEAAFEPSQKNDAQHLRVFVNSGERGVVVRKLMGLQSGAYRFSQQIVPVRMESGASAYWQLLCLQNSALSPIWKSDIDKGSLVIPAACKGQYLELTVAGGAAQNGSEVLVKSISFAKLQ